MPIVNGIQYADGHCGPGEGAMLPVRSKTRFLTPRGIVDFKFLLSAVVQAEMADCQMRGEDYGEIANGAIKYYLNPLYVSRGYAMRESAGYGPTLCPMPHGQDRYGDVVLPHENSKSKAEGFRPWYNYHRERNDCFTIPLTKQDAVDQTYHLGMYFQCRHEDPVDTSSTACYRPKPGDIDLDTYLDTPEEEEEKEKEKEKEEEYRRIRAKLAITCAKKAQTDKDS